MSKIEVSKDLEKLLGGKLNGGFTRGELSTIGANLGEGLSHKSNYLHHLYQRSGVTPPQPKVQIDLEGSVDWDKLLDKYGIEKIDTDK